MQSSAQSPGGGYMQLNVCAWVYMCVHIYIYVCVFVVVDFDALAQASDIQIERRHVVFLCWMQDLNPGPRHQIPDWMLADKPTELTRIKLKNFNSTARPYDQRAFSPLDPTVSWLSHLALAIYIFVVVNFDALAQASDTQIERRHVVFLCWMQDLNPGPQTPNCQCIAPWRFCRAHWYNVFIHNCCCYHVLWFIFLCCDYWHCNL